MVANCSKKPGLELLGTLAADLVPFCVLSHPVAADL
jgi:hypothetical protein